MKTIQVETGSLIDEAYTLKYALEDAITASETLIKDLKRIYGEEKRGIHGIEIQKRNIVNCITLLRKLEEAEE